MEKPTIIKLKETEQQIIEVINKCEIPVFVLKPTIEKILMQLELLEKQEYETELKRYNETLEKNTTELESESDK
jgi:hypothetical protein